MLLTPVLGRAPVSRRAAGVLMGVLLAPLFAAPLLALQGTTNATYLRGFTRLMELGIFPVVTTFLVLCVGALRRARREGRVVALSDPRVAGFAASATLSVIGFVLGALIDGSNTLIPGHYHASIGAVTVSFMAVTYTLLEPLGLRLEGARRRRLATWQPLIFGVGQMVFACGFALAGAYGMLRKTYASQQHIDHLGQTVGLVVMSVGGLIAVGGGVLFLWLVVSAWRHRRTRAAITTWPALAQERGDLP